MAPKSAPKTAPNKPYIYTIKKADNHIKRPENCFMVWAREMRPQYSKNKYNNAETSKILGKIWNSMSNEDKKEYKIKAHKINCDHKRNNPGYKYKPRTKYKKVNDNDNDRNENKKTSEKREKKYKIVKSRTYSKKSILSNISSFSQENSQNTQNTRFDYEEPDYFDVLQRFYENITSNSMDCDYDL